MDKFEPELSDQIDSGKTAPKDDFLEFLEKERSSERRVLEELLSQFLREQRRGRRWKLMFRLFIVGYLLFLAAMGLSGHWDEVTLNASDDAKGHTAVVELIGPIASGTPAGAQNVIKGLQAAFKDPDTRGVILKINSPGGSPVQAGLIYDEIKRLRKKYPTIPLHAALEDACLSGGYYVAAAADGIHADKASLVGSIGVVFFNFGLEKVLEKIGIEDRNLTAGRNKAFLNPFKPMQEDEVNHAKGILDRIHGQFVQAVKDGRGDRLKPWKKELFQGLYWTADEAIELGLVDALGSVDSIARDVIKVEKTVDFTFEDHWVDRIGRRLTETMAQALTRTVLSLSDHPVAQ
ncbi:MAG: S49 family peptidase [Magnetococcales bacterium]|nr:S49 family peptidase [Magnetococcales bacterium]MBF0150686.1 S49 family peptidase [Magnetococcales bacterium]MBF0173183.1 S49 family peptidase [Magnetococcales bacterium]MBF0347581.1 S49 family peptidase [Magnetococcales bacterium]MBF0631692.1 S49 family peptidase [Magnetococcales bacterium]